MGIGERQSVIGQLRGLVLGAAAELSDAQLLERFLAGRDEAAFAALVRRHGALVLAVCRRVLGQAQDAEDAFQSTFLVLARKAASIRPRDRLAAWLHGVAYRAALKLRLMNARRRARERKVAALSRSQEMPTELAHDLFRVLDEELARLPATYRLPVILCDLEGKTHQEAARQLGWPAGTVSVRLARARRKLAQQLTRRGITLSAAALAVGLGQAARAAVPAPLFAATVKAGCLGGAGPLLDGVISAQAFDLAEGMVRAMLLTKLKTLTAGLLLLAALLLPLAYVALAAGQAPPQDQRGGGKAVEPAKKDLDALQGTWGAESIEREGKAAPAEVLEKFRVVFKGDRMTINPQDDNRTATIVLDPGKDPKWLDAIPDEGPGKGKRLPALYALDGDTLKLSFNNIDDSNQRPTEFRSTTANRLTVMVLRRLAPARPRPPAPRDDEARLQGTWKVVRSEFSGRATDLNDGAQLTFRAGRVARRLPGSLKEGTYTLDPAAQPKTIDFQYEDHGSPALYRFDGDTLVLALSNSVVNGKLQRPTDLRSGDNDETKHVLTLERVPAKEAEAAQAQDARRRCGQQLERVVTGLHRYHDQHGKFPSSAITDGNGKALLSWRVALLPFLGEQALYNEFRLDEPWDSAHNRKLLPRLPKAYASIGNQPKAAGDTFVQAFVGPDCFFEAGRALRIEDIADGTSCTVAVVMAAQAVPWTKPADLDYAADKALPSFAGGVLNDGLLSFAFADGSAHVTSNVFGEERERVFRAAITRNGGELVELEKLR